MLLCLCVWWKAISLGRAIFPVFFLGAVDCLLFIIFLPAESVCICHVVDQYFSGMVFGLLNLIVLLKMNIRLLNPWSSSISLKCTLFFFLGCYCRLSYCPFSLKFLKSLWALIWNLYFWGSCNNSIHLAVLLAFNLYSLCLSHLWIEMLKETTKIAVTLHESILSGSLFSHVSHLWKVFSFSY